MSTFPAINRFNASMCGLYFVTDPYLCSQVGRSVETTVEAAVRGGVRVVQVRDKFSSDASFLRTVERVVDSVGEDVPVIVNDRVNVFLAARKRGIPVAGVHVGRNDIAAHIVRDRIGPDAILGVSVGGVHALTTVLNTSDAIDYVGCGPVKDTVTKKDAPKGIGFDELARVAQASSLPVVAIGGLSALDVKHVVHAGAASIAVVSAIAAAADPLEAALEIRRAWDSLIQERVRGQASLPRETRDRAESTQPTHRSTPPTAQKTADARRVTA